MVGTSSTMTKRRRELGVVVVGPIVRDISLLVDAIPEQGGSVVAREIRVAPGGKGGNPAAAAAAFGARVRLLGAVGADDVGAATLAELERIGVDVSGVEAYAGELTGQIVHIVEPAGRRRYVEAPGANVRLRLSADAVMTGDEPAVMLLSTAVPPAAAQVAVTAARAAGETDLAELVGRCRPVHIH